MEQKLMGVFAPISTPFFENGDVDYAGLAIGIDFQKVLKTGIEPVIHGGMISRSGKRLGAGVAHVPMACFEKACLAFGDQYGL